MGIVIAALLASATGAYAGASILKVWIGWDRCYLRVFAATLCFSPAVNLFAKKPVIEYFLGRFHLTQHPADWPWWFVGLVLLIVGVCEEGIKAVPALVPAVRESVRSRASAAPMALTIGLGFALGEIWYVAYRIYVHDPAAARMPFYMLGGFIGERLFTIAGHGFLIYLALRSLLPCIISKIIEPHHQGNLEMRRVTLIHQLRHNNITLVQSLAVGKNNKRDQ